VRDALPRRRLALLALAAALGPTTVAAETVPIVGRATRTDLAITVYNQDLALVKDVRQIPLVAGEQRIRFEDVAAKIEPRTVAARSLDDPEKLAVVEQSYVFDLISPEKLMEKYVGKEVEVVETDEQLRTQTTRATLLSTNGGPVYRVDDRIAIGLPGRVVLPQLPEELYARPTLLWTLANSGPTRQKVEVSYLTQGLSWAADYVVQVNADDTRADLVGWVTLTNQSGARYDDAVLKLVAGQVHREEVERRYTDRLAMRAMAAPPPEFAEEAFFEYHLYSLDRRATVADNETKQMRLLAANAVPIRKQFLVVGQPAAFRSRQGDLGQRVPVGVFLELRNDQKSHLGMPLPAGTVRLYKQDASGAEQFIGEDKVRHTPKDEVVRLKAGDAFDVVATRVQTDYREINVKPYRVEVAFAVTIRNHKKTPVAVDVREPVGGEWKVVESSLPAEKIDAGTLGFHAEVPADGETTVTYRVRVAF
jgi:hypothetical protein